MQAATKDLMADGFGLGAYDDGQLDALFELLRQLRLGAGDFAERSHG
jgi:hypothetical protein